MEIVLKTGSATITMQKNGDITIEGKQITIKGSGMSSLKDKKSFKIELAVAARSDRGRDGSGRGRRATAICAHRTAGIQTSNRAIRSLATKGRGPRDPQLAQVDATGLGAHSA